MYLVGGGVGTNLSPLESSLVWGFVRGVVLRFTTKFSSVVSFSRLNFITAEYSWIE